MYKTQIRRIYRFTKSFWCFQSLFKLALSLVRLSAVFRNDCMHQAGTSQHDSWWRHFATSNFCQLPIILSKVVLSQNVKIADKHIWLTALCYKLRENSSKIQITGYVWYYFDSVHFSIIEKTVWRMIYPLWALDDRKSSRATAHLVFCFSCWLLHSWDFDNWYTLELKLSQAPSNSLSSCESKFWLKSRFSWNEALSTSKGSTFEPKECSKKEVERKHV